MEIVSACGSFLHTSSGMRLLDFSSGCFSYQHQVLVEEIKANLQKMSLSGRMFFSAPLAQLVKRLSGFFPGGRAVAYPCNSSAEAMEGALKLAIGFHKGRRSKIIGIKGSCQGNTLGALSVSGIDDVLNYFGQLPLNSASVGFGETTEMIEAIDDSTAAVVIEPIGLSDSLQLLPDGYLEAVRAACDRHGCLLIVNESFTGFGRLGHWFAWHAGNVVPDILVTGNVLGGNMIPYGAYIARSAINNRVYKRKDPALHGATTAGFPLGCAIACRVMDLLETEWQSGSFARRERLLFKGLTKMQAADPDRIRQIVVKGLVGGIRFYHADQASDFFHLAGRAGVLLHRFETTQGSSEWLAIFPPLLATEKEIVDGISLLMQCQPALQQSKFFIDK